jgi:hypothetical protein
MDDTSGRADAKGRLSEFIDQAAVAETVVTAQDQLPSEVQPVRPNSPEDAVQTIRSIARRTSEKNLAKAAWPAGSRSLRDIARDGQRF